MKNEFTAIIEDGGEGWYRAHSPEVPGANGQGWTPEEAVEDLASAIELVLEYLREMALESLPSGASVATVSVS